MPDLLEAITETDTAVLGGWAVAFADTAPTLEGLPQERRLRELLTLAREFARRAAWAADTAEGWWEEFYARLRTGMNGDKFRALVRSGGELCRVCRSVADAAENRWHQAEAAGAPMSAVRGAADALAVARGRLATVEQALAPLLKRAERPRPVVDWARVEEQRQVAKGAGLTLEQALAAVRKPD